MSKPNHQPLTAILDRFEDGQAVLLFEFSRYNKKELLIPKRYLPKHVKEGDILYLEIYNGEAAAERRRNLARKILDEILSGE